ncbi:MAG: hypothetical protein Q8942_13715 [Bacillota bacterium]|nr:hypothetical protein [Bacillota bacterium]
MLKELLPDIDFSDPHWGVLATETYSIEFNIGGKDPVESIMLHIRGEDAPIDVIKKICSKTAWRAIDTSAGDFIDFENCPEESFNRWKRYRDKIIDEFK